MSQGGRSELNPSAHPGVHAVTWTLIVLNVVIFLWDRQGRLFGGSVIFADLTMRPDEVMNALTGKGDRFPLATLFTSLFLHGNLVHLVSNLLFLAVFGGPVEEAFGPRKFAAFYIVWGLAASATHIFIDPQLGIQTLGASGAISGALGAYLLLFPATKLEIAVPLLPWASITVSAYILLSLWFLYQLLAPQQGVANWAHVGGFLAGMLTVLLLGGTKAVLHGRDPETDFA